MRPCNLLIRNKEVGSLRAFVSRDNGMVVFDYHVTDGVNASEMAELLEKMLSGIAERIRIGNGNRLFATRFKSFDELVAFLREQGLECIERKVFATASPQNLR